MEHTFRGGRSLLLCLFTLVGVLGVSAQEERLIRGVISDGLSPLSDVSVTIEGSSWGTASNSEGRYEIVANPGDRLIFRYMGMKETRILVEDVTRFLNVAMVPDFVELDEVVLEKKLKDQKQLERLYESDKGIVKTAFGFLDSKTYSGRIQVIDGEDINPINLCITDFLTKRFAGVSVRGSCDNLALNAILNGHPNRVYVFLRKVPTFEKTLTERPRAAVFDIDGVIHEDAPLMLDVTNIKRVAILSSMSGSVRYGSIAAGGVIVINTKNTSFKATGNATGITTATTKKSLTAGQLAENAPTYLKEMRRASSADEARAIYNEYAERYSASPYFYLDAYDHFYSARSDRAFADRILEDNRFRFDSDPVILKALGYLYQDQGRKEKAQDIFKEVFILRPEYSQSYLDMANAYRDAGQYAKAAAMFGRYQYLLYEGFLIGSDDFWLIQQHDSDNLFQMEGEDLGTDMRQVTTDPYLEGATRLVFEWNNSEAEFELQFINPNGAAYDWKHTYADNSSRIEDEKISGYSTAEYVIDPSTPGAWKVNVTYLGNKSLTPSYLKVTTYTNFGTSKQQKRVDTHKLFLKGASQQLLTINNPGVQ